MQTCIDILYILVKFGSHFTVITKWLNLQSGVLIYLSWRYTLYINYEINLQGASFKKNSNFAGSNKTVQAAIFPPKK